MILGVSTHVPIHGMRLQWRPLVLPIHEVRLRALDLLRVGVLDLVGAAVLASREVRDVLTAL